MAISSILQKYWPHIKAVSSIPLLLILGLAAVYLVYINIKQVRPAEEVDYSLFGDILLDDNAQNVEGSAFINNTSPLGELDIAYSDEDFAGFVLLERSSLLNDTSPVTNIDELRNGLLSYTAGEGDNLSTIAANFGISVNTIIWANNIENSSLIQSGQDIVILPVSGILHEVEERETLDSIASLYDVELKEIATFNDKKLAVGDTVVVPHAKPTEQTVVVRTSQSNLPSLSGYFASPVENGWNWGSLHDGDAVDISNSCGATILAAADGVVVSVGSTSNWNSGYGGFVRIEHANGTKTFYAHNSVNIVSVGDSVDQGQEIGKIGRTGRVYGSTGCHVHFGVTGARNPFVR